MKRLLLLGLSSLLLASCAPQVSKFASQPNAKADVLFDASHGETAGEADWVIDGGFSSFANMIQKLDLKVTSTKYEDEITYDKLKNYKVFVMPEPNIPLKSSEQEALLKYVKAGGSVMMISDHYNADRNLNRFDASEVFNGYRRGAFDDITKGMKQDEKASARMQGVTSSDFLNDNFGVRFRYNALNNVSIHTNQKDNAFSLLDGVKQVNMHAGATVAITNPEIAKGIIYPGKLSQKDKWPHAVDQGVYSQGGVDEGAFVAISKVGKGKAVFIGDSSMIEDDTPKYKREDNGQTKNTYDGFNEANHKQLLNNLMKWLSKQEDYTSFKSKVDLSEKTPLLAMESPQNSTEPKHEPWGTPSSHYKWYDSSTFASGSFGKGSKIPNATNTKQSSDLNSSNKGNSSNHSNQNSKQTTTRHDLDVQIDLNHPYIKIDVLSQKSLDDVHVEILSNGKQVGLFDGKPPGPSKSYHSRKNGDTYKVYFNGKIAREANQNITVLVKSGNNILEEKEMQVN